MWVRVFQNVEELRYALAEFRERYNQRWIVQRLDYLTQPRRASSSLHSEPLQIHSIQCQKSGKGGLVD